MIGSRYYASITSLGLSLMLTVALAASALAQTVAPEAIPQPMAPNAVGPPASPDAKPVPSTAPPPCTDCRGGEAGLPTSSDTVIMTKDGKTIVPRALMREQADFSLNGALRNVPGINRR